MPAMLPAIHAAAFSIVDDTTLIGFPAPGSATSRRSFSVSWGRFSYHSRAASSRAFTQRSVLWAVSFNAFSASFNA
jgi:hypothetical protein